MAILEQRSLSTCSPPSFSWEAVIDFVELLLSIRAVKNRTICTKIATVGSLQHEVPSGESFPGLGCGQTDGLENLPRSLPYVERSLNWVRVAQRFPVRVQSCQSRQRRKGVTPDQA
jgi:multidrug efflux system membrane fusion protein